MRILVTGHNGYIGSVLVPMLERAGHEVVGLDSDLFAPAPSGPPSPERRVACSADVRDVESEDLDGFDAVIHLAAVCNDPVGDLNPQTTYEINHQASVRLAEQAKRGRRDALPVLVLVQPLRQGGGRDARRGRRVRAGDPVRAVEGARRAGHLARSPTTRSARPTCATRPRTASRRGCASTSSSTTWSDTPHTTGEVLHPERRDAVAPARPRRGHLRPRSSPCSTRRASSSTTRPSTSARAPRTTGSATWPRSSRRSCPGRARRSPREAGPTSAPIRSTARRSRGRCRDVQAAVDRAPRGRGAHDAYARHGLDHRASSSARATCGSIGSASSRRPDRLDDELRWRVPVGARAD